MAEGWVYIAEEWRWTGAGEPPRDHEEDCPWVDCENICTCPEDQPVMPAKNDATR